MKILINLKENKAILSLNNCGGFNQPTIKLIKLPKNVERIVYAEDTSDDNLRIYIKKQKDFIEYDACDGRKFDRNYNPIETGFSWEELSKDKKYQLEFKKGYNGKTFIKALKEKHNEKKKK